MNIEELKKAITFRDFTQDSFRCVTATLQVHSVIKLDPRIKLDENEIKENLKESLVRHLYDDRREELYKAVDALLRARPYSTDFSDRAMELLAIAHHQPPVQ